MKKLTRKIIYWGTHDIANPEQIRHVILSNYLGLAIFLLGCIILTVDALEVPSNFPDYEIDSLGAVFFALSGLIALLLSRYGYSYLARFLISFFPVTSLTLFPLMAGVAIDEYYFWYPYAIVFASIKPQILFSFHNERKTYVFSLGYYLLFLAFIDDILIYYATDDVWLLPIIHEHHLFYGLAPVFGFLFISSVISYFKIINNRFENNLLDANEELKSIIEELKVTQQHLIQSEKMASLGTLVSGIAHELNNPLNHITGGLSLIESIKGNLTEHCDGGLKENCELATSMLTSGTNHATKIVKALMTFSYKGNPRLAHYPIREIVDNTLIFLKKRIPSDIEIIKDYRLNRTVPLYPEKIHQVLTHLFDNAVYASTHSSVAPKFIKIETYENKGMATLCITNSGNPIPEDRLSQVFDPFFTTKDPGEGVGLGLSICYTLIAEHRGKISVKNQPNGVSFIVKLPLSTEQ